MYLWLVSKIVVLVRDWLLKEVSAEKGKYKGAVFVFFGAADGDGVY